MASDDGRDRTDGPAVSALDPPDSSRGIRCRFEIAPPRHFIYPGLLLLLAEKPRHGYRLVDGLLRLGFGPVSRPSVYRALAELHADGLLETWSAEPTAGSTRHMYGLSVAGHRQLSRWIAVVTSERDALDQVVKRFDAVCDAMDQPEA